MKAVKSIPLDAASQERALSALALAYQLAGRLAARTSLPYEDAIDAAVDGLLHAACRYDVGRGANFATFAHLVIRHRLHRAMQAHLRRVRRGRTLPFSCLDARDPTHYFDPADNAPPAEYEDTAAERRALLARVEGLLPPRLWQALRLYHGEGLTLEQVAERIGGIGKERVRQLVCQALRLARCALPERVEDDPVPRH